MCFNGNKNCHHEPAPRGSKTGTQGLKGAYERGIIPPDLFLDLFTEITTIEENKMISYYKVEGEVILGFDHKDDCIYRMYIADPIARSKHILNIEDELRS